MKIEDQLYGLAFASETDQDLCLTVSCARRWSEVEDALVQSCTAAGRSIDPDEHVDLYINVRVTNGHPSALDTLLRVRFTVKFVYNPSDRGYWNARAMEAAKAAINDGIVSDAPEGGKLQSEDTTVVEPAAAAEALAAAAEE